MELKPCPFCGGTASIIKMPVGEFSIYHKGVGDCIASYEFDNEDGGWVWYSEEAAISAWNRRADKEESHE